MPIALIKYNMVFSVLLVQKEANQALPITIIRNGIGVVEPLDEP